MDYILIDALTNHTTGLKYFSEEERIAILRAGIKLTACRGFAREHFSQERGFLLIKRTLHDEIVFQAFSQWKREGLSLDSYDGLLKSESNLGAVLDWIEDQRNGKKEPEQLTIW